MSKNHKRIIIFTMILMMFFLFSVTAFAITEDEVRDQVNAKGREAVSGNVFVWFLCSIAFLKVSQKIDSFMSSLGINVGHTGGNMLAEAMVAARGIQIGKGVLGGGFGGKGSHGASGASGADGKTGFMSGGLAGVIGRKVNQGAVKTATDQGGGGIAGKAFMSSMQKGGGFANSVIGSIAKGSISSTGTMTGENASAALQSYMGIAGRESAADTPSFSDVEIGGGRIMGTETMPDNPGGIQFGMYNADQYMAPDGEHSTVKAVDGSKWYKQYASDTVERTPYKNSEGFIDYNEKIVKKLPPVPRRKDKV